MYWKTWLPLIAAVAVAMFVVVFSGTSTVTVPPSTASPSVAVTSSVVATTTARISPAATSTSATPVKEDPAVVSARQLTASGANLLKSVVNILCAAKSTNKISGASGSGVVIDSRGLIITAAHIGQYFLLADYPRPGGVSCVIRTGGPATDAYTASLVYLSPSWIKENPQTLITKAPKGTGENDFAILAITGSATNTPLPAAFDFVPLGTDVPKIGEKVALGGYAAQYLDSATVRADLFPTIVFDPISDRYTFDTNTVDVLAVTGTAAAQEGSSGGGVVDEHDQLVAVITTSSISGDISSHKLNAITTRHIRASFSDDTGNVLDAYLAANDLKALVANFAPEFQILQKLLVKDISR